MMILARVVVILVLAGSIYAWEYRARLCCLPCPAEYVQRFQVLTNHWPRNILFMWGDGDSVSNVIWHQVTAWGDARGSGSWVMASVPTGPGRMRHGQPCRWRWGDCPGVGEGWERVWALEPVGLVVTGSQWGSWVYGTIGGDTYGLFGRRGTQWPIGCVDEWRVTVWDANSVERWSVSSGDFYSPTFRSGHVCWSGSGVVVRAGRKMGNVFEPMCDDWR